MSSAAISPAVDTVAAGQQARLTLVTRDAHGGTVTAHQIVWMTQDSTVAGFTVAGLVAAGVQPTPATVVTARIADSAATEVAIAGTSPGVARIVVTADGQSATATIVVRPAPSTVASATITPAVDTIIAGQLTHLSLEARDDRGAAVVPRDITWSTKDSSIIGFAQATMTTMSATGTLPQLAPRLTGATATKADVGGTAPGVATIVATVDGHAATAKVVVLPRVVVVSLRRDTVRLHVGESSALVATPLDAAGAPVTGRRVAWRSSDTTVAVVRADGVLTARGTRTATIFATVDGATAAAPVTVRPPVDEPARSATLDVATYEGSGEVVHPDVIRFAREWNGHRYWMAITPYPNADETVENPSVYASDDGENWELPPGAVNPIAKPRGGHLSDPALVFDESSNRLMLYFREALGGTVHSHDNVYLTTTADGVRWTAPELAYADTGAFVVSPTVVRGPDGRWRDWAVNAGADGCRAGAAGVVLRTSTDGRKWSAAKASSLVQPGYVIWHIDVQWVPARREYWALYAAFRTGATCGTTDVFVATSADAERWTTYRSPLLAHGAIPAFQAAVYRSTFAVDTPGDSTTLWFSGARVESDPKRGSVTRWSAAIARTSVAALFQRVNAPPAPALAPSSPPAVMPDRAARGEGMP